ncbi:beta-defensin 110-like [Pipistrellus kuhlii]|uniref:beta-defensin 110-like n=1 Tax=Pipistrellus kuhlii TaxID=59472 RepID=UPI00174F083F|nr:beta-defensin 110-like [Pipistrellus kuhlii]
MKILLFSFILFFFGVFMLSVGSGQPDNDSLPEAVPCRRKFEKAYSLFEKAQTHADSRKVDPFAFNRSEICVLLSGQCKRQCGEKEFRMVYCVIPTVFCCIRECEPYEYY